MQPGTTGRTLTAQLKLLQPTTPDLVDAGFLAGLCLLALAGFLTGFDDLRFLAVAAAGLLVGVFAAHVANSFRWPWASAVLFAGVAYFVLGGPLAVPGLTLVGLPTAASLASLGTSPITGWMEFLTTLPPVDGDGPVLALPWLAGLLGGAVTLGSRWWPPCRSPGCAVAAARRLDRPGHPRQPASRAGAGRGLRRGARRVARRARTARARRCRTAWADRPGSRPVPCSSLAVLAGLLAGALLPGTQAGAERRVVRSALVPPPRRVAVPQPVARVPALHRAEHRGPLRQGRAPGGRPAPGALVRFATLDAYDGLVWGAADRSTDGVAPFQQVGSRIAPRGDGTPVDVSVEVEAGGYGGNWLPTVGAPTRVEFDGPRADELPPSCWLNPDTDTAVVPGGLLGGERYTMSALLPPTAPTELPDDLDVGGASSSRRTSTCSTPAVTPGPAGPRVSWGKLRAVATQMRTEGTYTDGGTPNSFEKVYLPGHAAARLSRFVNSTKLAGNDEQYAATLALVGQRLGIPSRVVMGAEPEAGGEVRGLTCTPGSRCGSTTAAGAPCRPSCSWTTTSPPSSRPPASSSSAAAARPRRRRSHRRRRQVSRTTPT